MLDQMNQHQLYKDLQTHFDSKGELPCEKRLGSRHDVDKFANFWEHRQKNLGVLMASYLLDYVEREEVSPKEFAAYKQGCADISGFFQKCAQEKQLKVDAKSQENLDS